MNLQEVEKLAKELIAKTYTFNAGGQQHKVNIAEDLGYRFEFDNARRRLGCCRYGRRVISLSKPLCLNNLDKLNGKLTDTILHEIAHALCVHVYGIHRGRGHGANWVSIATQIGCNGNRCYTNKEVKAVKSKYKLVCLTDGCGTEIPRHRKPRRDDTACAKCCKTYNNGKYTDKFKLKLVVN